MWPMNGIGGYPFGGRLCAQVHIGIYIGIGIWKGIGMLDT